VTTPVVKPLTPIYNDASKVITVAKGAAGEPDVRMFDLASVNQHIESSMAALDPGKKVAFIAYADGQGVKGAIVGRIDAKIPGEVKWTVFAERPYSGQFTWGAGVKWSI
jgi:hypothetical protein